MPRKALKYVFDIKAAAERVHGLLQAKQKLTTWLMSYCNQP
tara:strand:+ start:489 stop:611 length:123 start_codon:yes stop_codon:yes gene_type:complete